MLEAAGVAFEAVPGRCRRARARSASWPARAPERVALALAEAKALAVVARAPGGWCSAAIRWSRSTGGASTSRLAATRRPSICGSSRARRCASTAPRRWRATARCVWRHGDAGDAACPRRCRTTSSKPISTPNGPRSAGCVGVFRIEGRGVQLFERDRGRPFHRARHAAAAVLGALRELGELPA